MTDYFKTCTKCDGCGRYESRRGYVGKCFACFGTGRTFKSKAAKAAYKAEKAAKAANFMTENGRWLVGLAFYANATGDPIAHSALEWAKKGKMPTEKMLACIHRGVARTLTKLSTPPEEIVPVVEGKGVTLTGEIASLKEKDSPYGWTLKMLVMESRGFKVWGTVPKALRGEVKVGDKVRFVANTKVSDRDPDFGFFSRPRKAELLAA